MKSYEKMTCTVFIKDMTHKVDELLANEMKNLQDRGVGMDFTLTAAASVLCSQLIGLFIIMENEGYSEVAQMLRATSIEALKPKKAH